MNYFDNEWINDLKENEYMAVVVFLRMENSERDMKLDLFATMLEYSYYKINVDMKHMILPSIKDLDKSHRRTHLPPDVHH
jgi:hypothetical protein